MKQATNKFNSSVSTIKRKISTLRLKENSIWYCRFRNKYTIETY